MTTTPTQPVIYDQLVTAATEAEARKVMAARVALKRVPGTHGEQAALLEDVDRLLDSWLELDHGQASAPHR